MKQPAHVGLERGLTLIEILVALSILSIISLAITGLMVSNLQLRRQNQLDLEAQQFAYALLERHKDHWSVRERYTYNGDISNNIPRFIQELNSGLISPPGGISSADISYACLLSDGDSAITDPSQPLNCSQTDPPLRRVTVRLFDNRGTLRASLSTEIGKPSASTSAAEREGN
jgi:prepilin-type N-terminal cleavage/methylation domain-containing protein